MSMEYEHKGVKIKLDVRDGTFDATIGPKFRSFPSLAAAKKAIEAHLADAFQPFDALTDRPYRDKPKSGESPHFRVCKVIGIDKATGKRTWSNRDQFVLDDNSRTRSVVRDTPEHRAAWTALREYENESQRIKTEREAMHEKLSKAIKREEFDY